MRIALWTHGEAPHPTLASAWTRQCDLVVAADGGLESLHARGFVADEFVGDRDSLKWDDVRIRASSRKSTLLERDKDDSDTEAALKRALTYEPDEVWLFGGAGGRMDHWLSNAFLFSKYPALTRWVTAWETVYSIQPQSSIELSCLTVSIFPWGSGPWGMTSSGLVWPVDAIDFAVFQSLSNRTVDGSCRLKSERGQFLAFVPGDAS